MNVLNPKLYRALAKVFAAGVRVQKQGEAMAFTVKTDYSGRQRIQVQSGRGGEDYKVCCPFCGDRRYRCEINHRWNTRDPATGAYFGPAFLKCYNDGCDLNFDAPYESRRDCHEQMVMMTKPYIARGMSLMAAKAAADEAIVPAQLPEQCVPLGQLPSTHPAIQFLVERQLDPYVLDRDWQLMYCIDDPNQSVARRIIIPIYHNNMLVGWQARYVGTPPTDNIPKYYTMPRTPRNRALYNYDRAKTYPFGVIVEGPSDAWRVGLNAVSVLGSALAAQQLSLLREAWSPRGVVLMMDPDFIKKPPRRAGEPSSYARLKERLRLAGSFAWGIAEVQLPDGSDPGSMDRNELWGYIERAVVQSGFPL